jgi:hypothetical protein
MQKMRNRGKERCHVPFVVFPQAGMSPRDNIICRKWSDVLMFADFHDLLDAQRLERSATSATCCGTLTILTPVTHRGMFTLGSGVLRLRSDFLQARLQLTDASILTSRAWRASLPPGPAPVRIRNLFWWLSNRLRINSNLSHVWWYKASLRGLCRKDRFE